MIIGERAGWVSTWLIMNDLDRKGLAQEILKSMPKRFPGNDPEQATYEYLRALFPKEIEALGDKAFMG